MPKILPFKEHVRTLHQDGIIWKADMLWNSATDPDDQANAVEQLVATMLSIRSEVKRSGYIDLIQKNLGIKQNLLKKEVKTEIERREKELADKKSRARVAGQINLEEVNGLPSGFKGDLHDVLKYGIYEYQGVYYSRAAKGSDYPVSNFTMNILYHIKTSDEKAYRMISIKNVYGFEKMIMINTDDFVSLGSFKKVIARFGDYIFKGTDSDLCRLQELLQKTESSTSFVNTLGYNKRGNFYAFANAIIPIGSENDIIMVDKFGIAEYKGKKYVIPAMSIIFEEMDELYENEKKFKLMPEQKDFGWEQWCRLFCRAYEDKGKVAILFYLASLYSDAIFKTTRRYPILNLFGPPMAGKGEVATSIMSMFGEPQAQIMLGGQSTAVGFMRKMGQFSNAIIFLDEYKNNLPQKVIESLKNIYDRIGYERGKKTTDLSTESTPIKSACILAGQEMPTIEPALFTRCIMLSFKEGKFTADQSAAFQELKDREQRGLSYITASLVHHKKIVEDKFQETLSIVFKAVRREIANPEVEDRMIFNISVLLAIYNIFKGIVHFPFKYEDVKSWMIDNMLKQHLILHGNNDLGKFWQVIESLFHQGTVVDGRDFCLQDGYIFLSLERVHGYYQKELIQRRDPNVLSKSTLEHYFKVNTDVFIDNVKKRFPDGSNVGSWKFQYNKLGIDLIKISDSTLSADQVTAQLKVKYTEMGVDTTGMEESNTNPNSGYQPFDEPL